MMVFGAVAALLFLITFATTKERVQPPRDHKTSLWRDLGDLVQNVPWIVLSLLSIFTLLFVSIRQGSIIYYFKYYVGNEVIAGVLLVCGTLATIAGI